jgi:hypothetical protein
MADLAEISRFVVSLATNPEQAQRFREDPEAVLDEAGVSDETKKILASSREEFMGEVISRTRPRVTVKTSVHVSTNVNNHVTTTVLVVIL